MRPAPIERYVDGSTETGITATAYGCQIPSDGGYAANGNLLSYSDSVMGQWSFSYDALNRLTGAAGAPVAGGADFLCWQYDDFGNRLLQADSSKAFTNAGGCQAASGASLVQTAVQVNAQNQMTQVSGSGTTWTPAYDAGGNLTTDNANNYLYYAEGRICAVAQGGSQSAMEGYLYDASGQRVGKGTITTWSCDPTTNGFNMTTAYLLGPSGAQMTEMTVSNGSATWQHTDLYAGGALIGTNKNDNQGVHFRLTDWLGSMRAQTNYAGQMESTCTSLPFGDGPFCSQASDKVFTGKERDIESGLDYFGARYYASSMGRWMSPDPGKINPKHLMNPQKWNKYAYVLNNPLSLVDPDGLEEMWVQYRAFIPPAHIGIGPLTGRGDNRSFSTQENASSRVSITMHIETDPAKNGGNPLLGLTTGVNSSHTDFSNKDTPAVIVQAPTVTATQDANGNVNLNVQMNVHSGDLPAATAIRSDVNIGVNEAGTQASVSGTTSVSPAFETNIAPQGGPTTNIPVQDAPAGNRQFFQGLLQDHHVDTGTKPIKQPGQP